MDAKNGRTRKGCKTCRHDPGGLKKAMLSFFLYIQTGRDRELRKVQNDPDLDFLCPDWEEKRAAELEDCGC